MRYVRELNTTSEWFQVLSVELKRERADSSISVTAKPEVVCSPGSTGVLGIFTQKNLYPPNSCFP